MENSEAPKSLTTFQFEGVEEPVTFVETMQVTAGVTCDVYRFDDDEKDLGIINIESGSRTPLQRVLSGDRTIEGYISGKGRLLVTKPNGEEIVYEVGSESDTSLRVNIAVDEVMQWQADPGFSLVAYEICFPPYQDGRYENIPDSQF